ncbi:hypothetical protein Nocox_33620 [Nonomuraea coxensis DSM 45129]|uniref:Uncharacterized protein n=1 Tax=Nonomuraea coxensis DSM 45129 TaxID=1122611 RepID=A0ABX8UCA8_9ACTN|nr:hypothetical protein Nocox_33620 [Nonomuraea coxensis DSM 45129]
MSGRPPVRDTYCSLLHLPPAQKGAQSLLWYPARRFERFRVIAWTCHEHRETWYELCESGGLSFIRRLTGPAMRPHAGQTYAWRTAKAWNVWLALLSGKVR